MGKHTAYKMPAQLFHADRSTDAMHNLNNLITQRITADSTYRTHITVNEGELFIAIPRLVSETMARVQANELSISRLWNSMPGVMHWNYIT